MIPRNSFSRKQILLTTNGLMVSSIVTDTALYGRLRGLDSSEPWDMAKNPLFWFKVKTNSKVNQNNAVISYLATTAFLSANILVKSSQVESVRLSFWRWIFMKHWTSSKRKKKHFSSMQTRESKQVTLPIGTNKTKTYSDKEFFGCIDYAGEILKSIPCYFQNVRMISNVVLVGS